MPGQAKDVDGFIDLVDQIGNDSTGTFDILGIGKNERDHTRMLAWMLRPTGSHGLGISVIESLLSEAEVSGTLDLSAVEVSTFDQNPSKTELDIVIEAADTIIAVEIKTQGQLDNPQYNRQVDYLEKVASGNEQRAASPFDSYEYIYISADGNHNPEYVQHQLNWDDLLDVIVEQAGNVTQDTDAIRIREWTRFARAQLTESEGLSPATELQLAYPKLVEQHSVNLDFESVRSDRQRVLSSYWQWLTDEHAEVANGEDGWETSRSRIEPGTKYIRLRKESWPSKMRLELQATKERMTADQNHSGPQNEYRMRSPHIEVTLTYSGIDKPERDKLISHMKGNGDETLRTDGFVLIREELPDDGAEFNSYHVYSKQVPIDFSNPEYTVKELRQGTDTLLKLEQTLDQFHI